jgi:hypothetical protein
LSRAAAGGALFADSADIRIVTGRSIRRSHAFTLAGIAVALQQLAEHISRTTFKEQSCAHSNLASIL